MKNFKLDKPHNITLSPVEQYHANSFINQTEERIKDIIFVLKRHIIVENFYNGALLLNLHSRKVTEIDSNESWILNNLDGREPLHNLVVNYTKKFSLNYEKGVDKVKNVLEKLWNLHFLKIQGCQKGEIMDNTRYVQNPDVNLREEDEDGALLFNPDTDQVQLLSKTGLFIWKLCQEEQTVNDIVNAFKTNYDEVPEEKVTEDVEEFLKEVVDYGFVGIVDD